MLKLSPDLIITLGLLVNILKLNYRSTDTPGNSKKQVHLVFSMWRYNESI